MDQEPSIQVMGQTINDLKIQNMTLGQQVTDLRLKIIELEQEGDNGEQSNV